MTKFSYLGEVSLYRIKNQIIFLMFLPLALSSSFNDVILIGDISYLLSFIILMTFDKSPIPSKSNLYINLPLKRPLSGKFLYILQINKPD